MSTSLRLRVLICAGVITDAVRFAVIRPSTPKKLNPISACFRFSFGVYVLALILFFSVRFGFGVYVCEGRIEKSVPKDHHMASQALPRDDKR